MRRVCALATALLCVVIAGSSAQDPGGGARTTARVETAPIEIVFPDRYQPQVVFEPTRRVQIMAIDDGIVRALPAQVGAAIREGQDLAQLDRLEATARLKAARAQVKVMQAALDSAREAKASTVELARSEAQVEAAQAEAEIVQLALDRLTLKAPFAGRLLGYTISPGQYVVKGTNLADLADVSGLKVLLPVDRTAVKEGASLDLATASKTVAGKVQTVLPLPEWFANLRELAVPWAAAWVVVENKDGGLEPGQRVRSPYLPTEPITAVPSRALRATSKTSPSAILQIVRNEYVVDLPVRIIGDAGLDRTQIMGEFRRGDFAVVSSSIPLAAGTFLRFGVQPPAGSNLAPDPNASGFFADVTPPPGAMAGTPSGRVAPIGSPGGIRPGAAPSTASRPPSRPTPGAGTRPAAKPATKPATKPAAGGGVVPF